MNDVSESEDAEPKSQSSVQALLFWLLLTLSLCSSCRLDSRLVQLSFPSILFLSFLFLPIFCFPLSFQKLGCDHLQRFLYPSLFPFLSISRRSCLPITLSPHSFSSLHNVMVFMNTCAHIHTHIHRRAFAFRSGIKNICIFCSSRLIGKY